MTTPVGGLSNTPSLLQTTPILPQQINKGGKDSDGDTDNSQPGEIEKTATSSTLGTKINTKA